MINNYNKFNEGINQYLKGPSKDEIINNMIDKYGENYFRRFKCIRKIIDNNSIDILKDIIIKLEYDDGYIYSMIKITFEHDDKKDFRNELCSFVNDYSTDLMNDITLQIKRYYNITLNSMGKSYSEVFDYINNLKNRNK